MHIATTSTLMAASVAAECQGNAGGKTARNLNTATCGLPVLTRRDAHRYFRGALGGYTGPCSADDSRRSARRTPPRYSAPISSLPLPLLSIPVIW